MSAPSEKGSEGPSVQLTGDGALTGDDRFDRQGEALRDDHEL